MIIKSKASRVLCLVPVVVAVAAAAQLISSVEGGTSAAELAAASVPEKQAVLQAAVNPEILREYYDTGEVKSVYRMQSGHRSGPALHFYRDGELKGTESWASDVRDGKFAMFFDGGGLRCIGEMKADKLHGRVSYFTAGRTVKFIETFENGASVGREYK